MNNTDYFYPEFNVQPDAEAAVEAPPPTRWQLIKERALRYKSQAIRVGLFVAGIVAAFVAILIYQAVSPKPHLLDQNDVKQSIASAFASATPLPAYSEVVYRQIQPSLVLIEAQSSETDATGQSATHLGSGVIVSDQGDILTALHVVSQTTSIQVTFADGTKSLAEVTVSQPENDIAVLHAAQNPNPIVPATLGNPNAVQIGDEAFAVGNPFGLTGSMSAGVISGFGRSIQPIGSENTLTDLIQIDAAVNPGNSGGPLLNRNGEVVGIVTGLVNPTDQNFFVGIGFAVPITTAAPAAGAPQT